MRRLSNRLSLEGSGTAVLVLVLPVLLMASVWDMGRASDTRFERRQASSTAGAGA